MSSKKDGGIERRRKRKDCDDSDIDNVEGGEKRSRRRDR
jgi:hypothetical protein